MAELRRHPHLVAYEYTKGPGRWQVSWFTPRRPSSDELLQVYVDDATGQVTQVWTGFRSPGRWRAATRARSAARSTRSTSGCRCASLFLLPFFPLAATAATLLHLDLLMLLGFSLSLAFFNHAEIGLSVPLVYPFLLYLLVRMLLLAFGKGRPREPLRLHRPDPWLAVGVDLPGRLPDRPERHQLERDRRRLRRRDRRRQADPRPAALRALPARTTPTATPTARSTTTPTSRSGAIFGWSGVWDDLPAAHAAAIAFDLLTLGRAVPARPPDARSDARESCSPTLWAAYPFTLFALSSNTNDALVARCWSSSRCWRSARRRPAAVAGAHRRADQVRAAGARRRCSCAASATGRVSARLASYVFCVRADHRDRGDAAGPAQRAICTRSGRLDRLPGQPRRAVLDLGPVGRARDRCSTSSRASAVGLAVVVAFVPRGADDRRGRGARRSRADRPAARDQLLVLPLHRLVLPALLVAVFACFPSESAARGGASAVRRPPGERSTPPAAAAAGRPPAPVRR